MRIKNNPYPEYWGSYISWYIKQKRIKPKKFLDTKFSPQNKI
tara:strand:+ start:11864 stop:11989 length:126 start_codon:yes stop_codon:yes gene_type:complete